MLSILEMNDILITIHRKERNEKKRTKSEGKKKRKDKKKKRKGIGQRCGKFYLATFTALLLSAEICCFSLA